MSAPLEGIRVVELASFVAAPSAGALLADLGADVIKVEVPWGEIYRHSTPRMAGYDSDFPASAPYQMDNHGKRSLTLDLALPQAQDALRKVVDTADVLLTNMLPSIEHHCEWITQCIAAQPQGGVIEATEEAQTTWSAHNLGLLRFRTGRVAEAGRHGALAA